MKKKRQGKIIEIIQKYNVGTQEELADRLREEGFQVTQATISRDIRELKLSKMSAEDGVQKYIVLEQNGGELENRYVRVLQEAYSSVDTAQNLVVIRTVSGMAMAVAAALDAMKLPEIVGCIAGDDTIFVAVHTQEETRLLREKVRMIVAREVHSEE
ncbi:arginine repressor [Acetatifactor muris]|jgi:transcriptional regulator of arginine metabolism|uniref:Arginine repressor n=1 Tax=Acetatifactor muris TaxID=879566 RepID=A0A2K4ZEF4_9FIRM|nr:arginine repressor [Acetatifactor muris]MCI8798625.1 arginine repressor [Lachnospiraceae bacterium]MCR2048459.1 arginine repressor [Acetatifactor muris]SOY28845.1 Arginine repressor [Acetatifactor muris]